MNLRPRALLAALALAGAFAAPAPAAAASMEVSCAGTQATTYEPGIRLDPRQTDVTFATNLFPCLSSDPSVTSGSAHARLTTTLSCIEPEGPGGAVTRVYHWSNGRSSRVEMVRMVSTVAGVTLVTLMGPVVRGEFTGATATEMIVLPALDPVECLSSAGITSRAGPVVLTIDTL